MQNRPLLGHTYANTLLHCMHENAPSKFTYTHIFGRVCVIYDVYRTYTKASECRRDALTIAINNLNSHKPPTHTNILWHYIFNIYSHCFCSQYSLLSYLVSAHEHATGKSYKKRAVANRYTCNTPKREDDKMITKFVWWLKCRMRR